MRVLWVLESWDTGPSVLGLSGRDNARGGAVR